jgi:hypothetical protein
MKNNRWDQLCSLDFSFKTSGLQQNEICCSIMKKKDLSKGGIFQLTRFPYRLLHLRDWEKVILKVSTLIVRVVWLWNTVCYAQGKNTDFKVLENNPQPKIWTQRGSEHNEKLLSFCCLYNIVRAIESRRLRWTGHIHEMLRRRW